MFNGSRSLPTHFSVRADKSGKARRDGDPLFEPHIQICEEQELETLVLYIFEKKYY
jgi:hypothetical protein